MFAMDYPVTQSAPRAEGSIPASERRVKWKAALFLALLFCVHATTAWAAQVVIVRTSDAEPYTQAETAIRERLAEAHCEIRSLLIKDVAEKGVDAAIGKTDAVVAVGTP